MQIKFTKEEQKFTPVVMEITIQTKEEATMLEAVFNNLLLGNVCNSIFGTETESITIPGSEDYKASKLTDALREAFNR